MSAFLERRDRNVIPRWRDFRSTVQLGELDAGSPPKKLELSHDLSTVTADWQHNKTTSFAGDLISAALVSQNFSAAREAAEFVISLVEGVSPALRALASRVLEGNLTPSIIAIDPINLRTDEAPQPSPEIASTRKRLIEHPSDAILWIDLAYLYAIRGLTDKAERAVRIALNLAPTNRFVVRSAARFFIHKNRVDIAHDIIRNSPGYKNDPWLVAAEIAVALSADRAPRSAREGIVLIKSDNFSVHHLSELNSAIGTLEFHAGSSGKAKKLFKRSLLAPNDNSLAQAKWVSQVITGIPVDVTVDSFQIARPFEAAAYEACEKTDWPGALRSALQWLSDQPFSSRPARLAAYLACNIFEDFKQSEQIAKFGLVTNPAEPGFHINLAYCYASTGRADEAVKELSLAKSCEGEEWVDAAIDANYGLLAFREGAPELARKFYEEAVAKADVIKDKNTKTAALIHWAAEEIGVKDSMSERLLTEAREAGKNSSGFDIPFLLDRLTKRIAEGAKQE
jgi:tetratricopeptide (TPR) repeat protein